MAGVSEGVCILAGEIHTCLGNLESTWNAMLEGKTGLVNTPIPHCTTDYPLGFAKDLQEPLGSVARLNAYLDNILETLPPLPPSTKLYLSTAKGVVDQLAEHPRWQLPDSGQPWEIAGYLQKKLGLTTKPETVSGACASGSISAIQAAMGIALGECDHALVVAVDLVGEFVVRGFDCLKALSPTKVKPFDQHRDGLALGDGAAWLLLAKDPVLGDIRTPLARISRWGISCDASHITAPCRNGSGLGRVFDQIIRGGSDASGDNIVVGAINGHGTGTGYNDAMEMLVFDQKCGRDVPFCSVKGALGHSLGASGLVEIVLSTKSLKEMKLPPTVGLEQPDGGRQNVSGNTALSLVAPSIITCNSGFGGINAGVYLTAA